MEISEKLNEILIKFLGTGREGEFAKKVLSSSYREPQSNKQQNRQSRQDDFIEEQFSRTLVRTQLDHIITFTEKVLNLKKHLNLLQELAKLSAQQGELSLSSDIYSHILYKTIGKQEFDNERAYALLGIGKVHFAQARWKEGLTFAHQSKKLFTKCNNILGIAESENLIGTLLIEKGELPKAKLSFESGLERLKTKKDRQLEGMLESNLGILFNITGELELAKKYYENALKKFVKFNDTKRIADLYHNLGMLYTKHKDYNKALENFNESISVSLDSRYLPTLAIAYLAKAYIYSVIEELELANNYLEKGLEISNHINDRLSIADIYKIKGIIQRKKKNYILAENYLLTSLRINSELNNKLNYAEACNELALLYEDMGNTTEAMRYYQDAQKYFSKVGAVLELDEIRSHLKS